MLSFQTAGDLTGMRLSCEMTSGLPCMSNAAIADLEHEVHIYRLIMNM